MQTRCTCGALYEYDLDSAAVQEIDEREYLELATCPHCGTTLCVRQWRLSASAKWRASVPPERDPQVASVVPVSE